MENVTSKHLEKLKLFKFHSRKITSIIVHVNYVIQIQYHSFTVTSAI